MKFVLLLGAALSVGAVSSSTPVHLKASPLIAFAPSGVRFTASIPLDSAAYQATIWSEFGSSTWLVDPKRQFTWTERLWRNVPPGEWTVVLIVQDNKGEKIGDYSLTIIRMDPHAQEE